MHISKLWIAIPLALIMAACGGEAEQDDTLEMAGSEDAAGMETGAPENTGMQGGMDTGMSTGMGSTVNLQALNNSGISGEATLNEQAGQVQVMVRLTGGQPNATHQGHIHQGTCDSLGSVVAPLQPVNVDAQGSGTSTSSVNVPMSDLGNGQHVIAYHEAGGNPGRGVVCGPISGHQM